MPATIQSRNLLHEYAQSTRLTNTEAAGTTTTRVQNTNGLVSQWAIQIGETGHEQTEVVIGTNASGTTITHPATTYEHPADTPVFFIKYNQVVFEKSTTGTTGTATSIANGTITYQADSEWTQFDDTGAASGDAYRTRFRNSVLGTNTSQSDWITPSGFDFYSLAKMRSRIKEKLPNSNYLNDQVVDDWTNECKDYMVNKAIQTNEDYSLGTVNVGFGTDGLGTITTADFGQVRRVWVTYDGNNKYASSKMNINDEIPDQTFSRTHPFHAWRGDNILLVRPSDAGTAEIAFYRWGTTMVNDTDTLPLPMRPFTHIFVNYGEVQALKKDQRYGEAEILMRRVDTQVEDFVTSLAPRDKSGPTMIDIVEPISGDDGNLH